MGATTRRLGAGTACVLAVCVVAGWHPAPGAQGKNRRPELVAAPLADAPPRVAVGANVHVSADWEFLTHDECVVAADPTDPNRLFAASMVWTHSRGQSVAGYASADGGATWRHRFCQVAARDGERVNDPTVAFGPAGELYLACMRYGPQPSGNGGKGAKPPESLDFFSSADLGRTWATTLRRPEMPDRPWLAVDTTSGPLRGRVYCTGNLDAPVLLASGDGARTFARPDTPDPRINCRPSNPVVLSDGTALFTYRRVADGANGNDRPTYPVFATTDGGKTAERLRPVRANWKHARLGSNVAIASDFPQLAVDPLGSPRKDRLHCVWADGESYAQRRVLYSRSSDRGQSWSDPVVLSEQPMGADGSGDYFAFMPCVAVNRAGVVVATWYDRRGLPPEQPRDGEYVGYGVRGRASGDGGESWGPSFALADKPNKGKMGVGHTAGLAASGDGRFHAAWIDTRTGRGQVWAAAVVVAKE